MYGRIPKTLHICSLAAEEAYRRDIKGMRNLQEGRHALADKTGLCHIRPGILANRGDPGSVAYGAGYERCLAGVRV